jgi:hypothetical protein
MFSIILMPIELTHISKNSQRYVNGYSCASPPVLTYKSGKYTAATKADVLQSKNFYTKKWSHSSSSMVITTLTINDFQCLCQLFNNYLLE